MTNPENFERAAMPLERSFSEDPLPANAPDWVRDLRKSNRQKDRRIRQLERENAALKKAVLQAAGEPLATALEREPAW